MSNRSRPPEGDDADGSEHLAELPDGSGCFEIWEHLSDRRRRPACD